MTADRLTKQLGIALEAIEAIADGEGTATVIAQQTLDEITRVGMEAIALEREEAPEPTEPAGVAGLADLRKTILDFEDFINTPPQYEELRRVCEYRNELYRHWEPLVRSILAALSRTPPLLEVAKEALNVILQSKIDAFEMQKVAAQALSDIASLQAIKGAEQ